MEDFLLKMHPHPMVSCEIDPLHSGSKCSFCSEEQIEGSAYRCTECVYVVHKSCAQYSFQYNHMKHEHPWMMCSKRDELSTELCHFCSQTIGEGLAYGCETCKYYMHKSCVESSSFRAIRKRFDTGIDHFSHEHPLAPCKIEEKFFYNCRFCGRCIINSGLPYGCTECGYYMHKSCGEFSSNPLQHSLHPQHLLIPSSSDGSHTCQGCGRSAIRSVGCEPCNFQLHIDCISLESSLKFQFQGHSFFLIENRVKHVPPPRTGCRTCGESSDDRIFKCMHPGCKDYFHAHCIPFAVPETVKHSCHYYDLTFVKSFIEDGTDEHYCDICEMNRDVEAPVYRSNTSGYEFTAHTACALLEVLPSLIAEWENSSAKAQSDADFNHELEEKKKAIVKRMENINFYETNFAMELVRVIRQLNLAEEIHTKYVLQLQSERDEGIQRQFSRLNLSGNQLLQQIEHPFHPPHPLTLHFTDEPGRQKSYSMGPNYKTSSRMWDKCSWCRKREFTERSLYQCDYCEFVLHPECASVVPSTRIRLADHLLFAYEKPDHFLDSCAACRQKFGGGDSNSPAFICVVPECSYALHIHCLPFPLPEKYDHKYHSFHNLFYTNPAEIEGEHSEECYCDDTDCEQLWNPDFPCYYCKECDYSVHIACCIWEMLPSLIEQYENDLLARGVSLDAFLPKFGQDVLDYRGWKEGIEAGLQKTRQDLEVLRQELARIETRKIMV